MQTLYEYKSIENKLSDEEAKSFELFLKKKKLNDALKISPTEIKAQNFVGVVKYKKHQFEILPKLLSNETDEKESIIKNLFYMLSYTKDLDIKDTDVAKLANSKNPFLEVLIGLFANSLYDNLLRYIPKNYVLQEENLSYLKGKLKFNENIRYNSINKAKFYCEYDDFSEDNLLNRLFFYVATMLSKTSSCEHNKKRLKQILNIMSDVNFEEITLQKINHLKLSRSQQSFDKPFKLAKMFVQHSSVEMSSRKFKTIALVWDMNLLFEEFIFRFICKNKDEINRNSILADTDIKIREVIYQNKEKLIDNSSEFKVDKNNIILDAEVKRHEKSFKNTFTDIILHLSNEKTIILDTKYKLNSGDKSDFNNADVYQMLAYKEINKNKNPEAVLIYPKDKINFAWVHSIDKESEIKVFLTCVDLSSLKGSETQLITRIASIVNWVCNLDLAS